MNSHRLLIVLVISAALAPPLWAQLPGPELPKLSNLAFGWVSMSGLDPTLDMITSFAPTMMCLRDAGFRTGGEAVQGQFTFGDFYVSSNFQSAMTAVGPGLVRICHYGYDSNTAEIPGLGMPGVLADTRGDAIELSYAQHVGKTTLGVSVVPKDSSSIDLFGGGDRIVTGATATDFGARVGAVVRLRENVKLGADFSYQEDSGEVSLAPALTGEADWVAFDDDFITRCGTVGMSWQPSPKTSVYASYQKILAGGGALDRTANLLWAGVQHSVTDTVAVRANYLDGGPNVSVQWRSKYGVMNVAYTHKALLNARDYLGIGDAAFIGWAMAL